MAGSATAEAKPKLTNMTDFEEQFVSQNVVEPSPQPNYEYAHSKRTLAKYGGALALESTVTLEQTKKYRQLTHDDFSSALREMAGTDPELQDQIDNDDTNHEFSIINGQVCAADGTPMTQVIHQGVESSREMTALYPEWQGFLERDEGDEIGAEENNKLLVGQTRKAVSWAPVKNLREHKKLYSQKGLREDLIWIQSFTRVDEDTLVASYYSVRVKNEDKFLEALSRHGIEIPKDSDYNQRIRYSTVTEQTVEEADQQIRELRKDYYHSVGETKPRKSVTEFIKQNQHIVDGYFDTYYPPLAEAAYSGHNNEIMKQFATSVLRMKIAKLKPEIKNTLQKVARSSEFNDEAVKVMDALIRYAVVEELRKGLKKFVNPMLDKSVAYTSVGPAQWNNQLNQSSSLPDARIMYSHQQLAQNLSDGVEAGRGYGGCPGIEIGQDDPTNDFTGGYDSVSFSGAGYGGGGRRRRGKFWESGDEDCEFVSKSCPKCKKKNVKTVVKSLGYGRKHIEGKCGCSTTTSATPHKYSYA